MFENLVPLGNCVEVANEYMDGLTRETQKVRCLDWSSCSDPHSSAGQLALNMNSGAIGFCLLSMLPDRGGKKRPQRKADLMECAVGWCAMSGASIPGMKENKKFFLLEV